MDSEKHIMDKVLQYINTEDMSEVVQFLFDNIPTGILIVNKEQNILYQNRKAIYFMERFQLPVEILRVSKRLFNAMQLSKLGEEFPGEIYIKKKYNKSPSNWTFRLVFKKEPPPYICIFIIEDTISNKLDLNKIRQQFRLTRRETDVLRRVLDGLKNLEIAEELEISEQTVKDHLSNIYMKTGVRNRFALMRELVNQ
jgi:DNA-binding CsgD family transcriptional regulator